MIPEALEHFLPGHKYSINGDTYKGIVPLGDAPMPTEEQVTQWVKEIGPILRNKQAERSRANAFKSESDPLFFKWQRGEATEKDYLDKVEEIRRRFPYEP